MTAALLAGCADSSRFIGDPLGNPFHSASNAPAASVPDRDIAPPPPYHPVRTASVQSQPLAPPTETRRVADYATPAHESPRLASTYQPPRTERTASIAASSGHGSWSATGGMPVIAATGDSASVLAQRYNVPVEALLHENGFASAAQVRPGTRVVIPVYSANGASPARVATAEPPQHAAFAHDHASRERLLAKHDSKEQPAREAKVARHEAPAPDKAAEKMHWVKGPQPVADAGKAKGREKAMAKLDRKAAPAAKVEAVSAKKVAKADPVESKPGRKVAAQNEAAPAVVREQPVKLAKVEDAPAKKVAVDPTPTASLPPADDKPSAGGNPEFRWPAHGRIIQGFKSGGNDGINIAVPEGTAVKAAENGVVAYAGSEIKGFGNLVLIRHPNGYVTAYANNGDIEVKRGEQVKRGQTIAKSGQSGNVASPQLHFELRKGSTPVDPTRYLAGL